MLVPWNGDVVFARMRRRQAHVASALARDGITNAAEQARKLSTGQTARQPQTVITS
jgi:hypothetical protein